MKRTAMLFALVLTAGLLPGAAEALPVSTSGLSITSAALEVRSVATPTTWVASTTVYEGSPARLVLGVDAPGVGVVRTTVTLPGVTGAVGDTSTNVVQGTATLVVPLDLSYGAWLAGPVENSADHLDVAVTYTATPPAPSGPSSVGDAAPTPTLTPTPTPTPTSTLEQTPASPTVSARPVSTGDSVRVPVTGSSKGDRRAIKATIDALPTNVRVVAIIRPATSRSSRCPSTRQLTGLVTSLAEAAGRTVYVRRGPVVRQDCPGLEIGASSRLRMKPRVSASGATFTVPITMAPRPVILVHGMWSSASIWTEYTKTGNLLISAHPQWRGYAVSTMNTGSALAPYAAVNTIAQNAALAWTFIREKQEILNAHEVDVVGHSLGGVITRRILHDPTNGAAAREAIRSVVLLGTPNGGSSCSTFWSVPANAELTYAAMETFNLAYPGYPGALTTSLYADHFGSTCFDSNAGDLFVPSWSTQAQAVNVVQRINPGIQHANMPGSSSLFSGYVRPVLALVTAPADAGPTPVLTNPNASSTKLDEGTATGASLAVTRTVTIQPGQKLVASVVGDSGATGTLTYPSGGGTATVNLVKIGDYPVFEADVSYATLGGTTGPLSVSVSIAATSSEPLPEWRWSLVTRT